jgi:nitrile hydratase
VRFAPGDAVRVSDRAHTGHHRTPGYLKGKQGRVARLHGAFRNPERRAYGASGLPPIRLYLVAFDGADVWGNEHAHERVYADVFEHWLEPTG